MRLLLALISLVMVLGLHAQVDVTATADTTVIRIGEQAKVTLEVSYEGVKPEVSWPIIKDTLQRFVEVVDPGVIDTIHADGRSTQRQEILITSWDSGYYAIPPFRFKVNGDDRETEAFLLSVQTMAVDTTAAPKELKAIYDQPFSVQDWVILNWPYLAIALLNRLRHDEAYTTLSTKAYYTKVTDVLREYLEQRFGIQAMEQTTAEISEHLRYADIKNEEKSRLHEVLMRADMAKFAKEDSSENVKKMALDKAIEFVEQSRRHEAPPLSSTGG